ncbi:hypothetical protein SteCoe_24838 [Stentor coeruleus]|uniref:Uncharacterized protein n=1 Tax=Stentor coeruleus TaxID=5963 RepID=A0A1R2BGK8_9CILI|nr:hypothetical protein SteCoe_24838 [Stentor coeruleus]
MINYDDYVISYNKQAMIALQNEQVSTAYNILSQAQYILKRKPVINLSKLLGLTYNNFGCFYKRTGEYPLALKCFQKSLSQESEDRPDFINQAGKHLNLCTLYSIMIEHDKALNHALQALKCLKNTKKESENYIFTLIMAYKNAGMELENISDYKKALIYYKKAHNVSLSKLGESHKLTHKIKQKIDMLIQKMGFCDAKPSMASTLKKIIIEKKSSSQTPKFHKPKKRKLQYNLTPLIQRNHKMGIDNISYIKTSRDQNKHRKLNKNIKKNRINFEIPTDPKTERTHIEIKRQINTSLGTRRKLENPHLNKFDENRKHLRTQSKSPEFLPLVFKRKLSLFRDDQLSESRLHSSEV